MLFLFGKIEKGFEPPTHARRAGENSPVDCFQADAPHSLKLSTDKTSGKAAAGGPSEGWLSVVKKALQTQCFFIRKRVSRPEGRDTHFTFLEKSINVQSKNPLKGETMRQTNLFSSVPLRSTPENRFGRRLRRRSALCEPQPIRGILPAAVQTDLTCTPGAGCSRQTHI